MKINKILLLLTLMLLLSVSFASATLDDADLYYSFDDIDLTGSNPDDLSGNGFDGTTAGATTGVTGILNEAFDFDGTNDDLSIPATGFLSTDNHDFSVSWWMKPDSTSGTQFIYSGIGETYGSLQIRLDGTTLQVRSHQGAWVVVVSDSSVSTVDWRHYTVTYDTSTGWILYENGVSVDTDSTNGVFSAQASSVSHMGTNDGINNQFDGRIDEFSIYSRTLTSTEVSDSYNSGSGINPYGSSSANMTLTVVDEWNSSNAVNNVEVVINGGTYTNTTGNLIYTDILINTSQTYDIALSGNNYFDKTYTSSTMEDKTLSLFQSEITIEARSLISNTSISGATYIISGMTNTTFHLNADEHTVLTTATNYLSQNDSFNVTALDNLTQYVYLGNHTATIGVINARTSDFINGTKTGYFQNVANNFNQSFSFTTNTTSLFLEGGLVYEFVFDPFPDYATNTGLSFNYTASGSSNSQNLELYENNSIQFTFKNGDTLALITTDINVTLFNDNETYNFNTSTGSYFLDEIAGGTYTLTASTESFNDVEVFVTVVNNEYQELNVFFGGDVVAKTFVVVDNSGDAVSGVVVTFTREVNSSTVTYGQKITDFSGAIQIYLNENTEYSLTAVKSGYETFSGDVTPFQDSYTINIEEEGSERFISSYDDISYSSNFLHVINSTYAGFELSIVSPSGYLQYFGASTTYNGTIYAQNTTGSPSGGAITFNITNVNTSLENTLNVTMWFKSVNNSLTEWNTIYLIDAEKGTNNVRTWDFSGLTSGAKATITMLILTFLIGTGIAVSRRIFVGALLGMIGIGFCMSVGLIPIIYATMTLITMALLIIGDLASGENR